MIGSVCPIIYTCTGTGAIIKWNTGFMSIWPSRIIYTCSATAAIIKWPGDRAPCVLASAGSHYVVDFVALSIGPLVISRSVLLLVTWPVQLHCILQAQYSP